jgi:hypothetical protein
MRNLHLQQVSFPFKLCLSQSHVEEEGDTSDSAEEQSDDSDEEDDAVDVVLTRRVLKGEAKKKRGSDTEYLIKFRGRSYLHLEWMTPKEIEVILSISILESHHSFVYNRIRVQTENTSWQNLMHKEKMMMTKKKKKESCLILTTSKLIELWTLVFISYHASQKSSNTKFQKREEKTWNTL